MKHLLFLTLLFGLGCKLTQDLGGEGSTGGRDAGGTPAPATSSGTTSSAQGGAGGGGTSGAVGGGGHSVAVGGGGTGGTGGATATSTCDLGIYTTAKPLCDLCIGQQCCAQFQACFADATCLTCATDSPDPACPASALWQDLVSCWTGPCAEPCGPIPSPP